MGLSDLEFLCSSCLENADSQYFRLHFLVESQLQLSHPNCTLILVTEGFFKKDFLINIFKRQKSGNERDSSRHVHSLYGPDSQG